MNFNSLVLLGLSVGISFGVPVYMYFREKMGNQPTQSADLSKRRVFKLTTINFFLNSLMGLLLLSMFLSLLIQLGNFDIYRTSLALLFFVFAGATFYGNGIYITSIILEAYTLPPLQRIKEFKTQFIATHLFHGPISHVLIYSGWPVAIFFLALLERTGLPTVNFPGAFLFIGGMITAITYAVGQIYNHAYPYQMITNTVLGIILLLVFQKNFGPVYLFSLAFTITTGIVLWIYFVQKNLQGKSVEWYISPDPLL